MPTNKNDDFIPIFPTATMKLKLNLIAFILLLIVGIVPDAVAQWVQTNGPYGGDVLCFAVDGSKLFAGTSENGIFVSTDDGTTWTSANESLNYRGATVQALSVSGSNILAGTYYGGLYLSSDGGLNWSEDTDGFP